MNTPPTPSQPPVSYASPVSKISGIIYVIYGLVGLALTIAVMVAFSQGMSFGVYNDAIYLAVYAAILVCGGVLAGGVVRDRSILVILSVVLAAVSMIAFGFMTYQMRILLTTLLLTSELLSPATITMLCNVGYSLLAPLILLVGMMIKKTSPQLPSNMG